MRFDLMDEEWALLEPLLPVQLMSARVDDRQVPNAIFYVLRTGIPPGDLPEWYGPYATAYHRFNHWSRRGIWKRMFDRSAAKSRDSLHLVDRAIVKAHQMGRYRTAVSVRPREDPEGHRPPSAAIAARHQPGSRSQWCAQSD